jgi:NAD(P)-dependent dehydrogenase (short-subunit alcohol dehydrogenase family)
MRVFITGADRGLGFGLAKNLLSRGFTVYAGQYMPEWLDLLQLSKHNPNLTIIPLDVSSDTSVKRAAKIISNSGGVDVFISNAAITGVGDGIHNPFTDMEMMKKVYDVNTLGAVRLTEYFIPIIKKSNVKKLIYISSEAGSVTECERTAFFWYCMSKAALNMYVKIMFNKLRPDGYKFRLYHPGWIQSYMSGTLNEEAALSTDEAAAYAAAYFFDAEVDEERLVLMGYDGREYEF